MADKEAAGYEQATGGQKDAYQQFSSSDKITHKRIDEPQMNKKSSSNDCNSISSSNGSSYYPSLNIAQKGKLILPTALWILLIIGGICFLTLMAALNKTMISLEKVVELEEAKVDKLDLIETSQRLQYLTQRGHPKAQAGTKDDDHNGDESLLSSFFGRVSPKSHLESKPKLHEHVSSLLAKDDQPMIDETLVVISDEGPLQKEPGAIGQNNDMLFKLLPDGLFGATGPLTKLNHNYLHNPRKSSLTRMRHPNPLDDLMRLPSSGGPGFGSSSSSSSGGVIVTSSTGPNGETSIVEQRFGDAIPSISASDSDLPPFIKSLDFLEPMISTINKDRAVNVRPVMSEIRGEPLVSANLNINLAGNSDDDMEPIAASGKKHKGGCHRRRPSKNRDDQEDLTLIGDSVDSLVSKLMNVGHQVERNEPQLPSLANLLMQHMDNLPSMDLNNGPAGFSVLIDQSPAAALESPAHTHHGHDDHKHMVRPKHQVHPLRPQLGSNPFDGLGAFGNLPPFIISLEDNNSNNNNNEDVGQLKGESVSSLGGHFGRPQIVQGNTHLPSTIGQSPYELLMGPASATNLPSNEDTILSSLIKSFQGVDTNGQQQQQGEQKKSTTNGSGHSWNMLADDLSGAFIQTILNSSPQSVVPGQVDTGLATVLIDDSSPPSIIMSKSKPSFSVSIIDVPPKGSPESTKKSNSSSETKMAGETSKSASELANTMLDSVLELDPKLMVATEQPHAISSSPTIGKQQSASSTLPTMGTLEDINKAKAALNDVDKLIAKTQASKASEKATDRLASEQPQNWNFGVKLATGPLAQPNIDQSSTSETMKQKFSSTPPPGSATTLRISDLDDEFGKEFGSLMSNIFTLPQSGGQTEPMRSESGDTSTKSSLSPISQPDINKINGNNQLGDTTISTTMRPRAEPSSTISMLTDTRDKRPNTVIPPSSRPENEQIKTAIKLAIVVPDTTSRPNNVDTTTKSPIPVVKITSTVSPSVVANSEIMSSKETPLKSADSLDTMSRTTTTTTTTTQKPTSGQKNETSSEQPFRNFLDRADSFIERNMLNFKRLFQPQQLE